jgi:outer membrane receptor protein involved in Fe transport
MVCVLLPCAAFSVAGERAAPRIIEEIVVTATKRSASLQEVPIAITAITGEALERNGVKDLRDLQNLSASFNMNGSNTESTGSTFRIRGIGTTGNNIGLESAVGVFVDGVYLSRPGVALADLVDVEAIEILRGPQGTLFGRNTSAGAVSIKTNPPDLNASRAWVNVGAGNFDAWNVQAGGSTPLIEQRLAASAAVAMRKRDGYVNSSTGAESNNRDRLFARAQLSWDLDERTDIRFIADYADGDEQCCDGPIITETPLVATGAFAAAGLPADGGVAASGRDAVDDRRSNAQQFENPFEQWGMSLEINREIADATLTYIGSYRDFEAERVDESDGISLDLYSSRLDSGDKTFDLIKSTTHELRLAGDDGRISWMIGGYYMYEDITEELGLQFNEDYLRNTSANVFGLAPAPAIVSGGLQILADSGAVLADGTSFAQALAADPTNPARAFISGLDPTGSYAVNRYEQTTRSWSVFTHNTINLTNRFDLVLGARWAEEEKDGSYRQLAVDNPACPVALNNAAVLASQAPAGLEGLVGAAGSVTAGFICFPFTAPAVGPDSPYFGFLPSPFDDRYEEEDLIWTVKGVYNLDTTIVYGSVTQGFKSGGFNLDSTSAIGGADPTFDSEIVKAYEVGFKSDLLDRRLRLNMALFYQDIEDFQVLEFTGVRFKTFNVPSVESRGAELEMQAVLNQFDLFLALTYQKAEYPSDCDDNDPNAPPQVASLCGGRLTNAPDWTGVLGVNWSHPLGGSGLELSANTNLRWETKRRTATQYRDPTTLIEPPADYQDENVKVNLSIGLGRQDERWRLEAWGQNLFDEQTFNVTYNTPLRGLAAAGTAAQTALLEMPRSYGLTFRTRW